MHDTIVEPSLPVGFVLQSYEIEEVLGVGGFGITYLGVHRQLRKKVAIKEFMPRDFSYRDSSYRINPSVGSGSSNKSADIFEYGLGRFLTEAQDLVRFEHPHIVKATDYFELHGTAYIVMDYVEGQTLERWLKTQGYPPEEEALKSVFLPLLDGLKEVHNYGLLHRDIKPDNIYIKEDGSPLLIDFGAARSAVGSRSRSWHVVVAEGYSPKEQYATSGKQGPWTDIYAVGATLLRCISGQVPVGAMDRSEAFDHNEADPMICASREFKGTFSDTFLNTIDHCLCFSGQDRPQTVRAVQDGLLGNSEIIKPPVMSRQSRRAKDLDEAGLSVNSKPWGRQPWRSSEPITPTDELSPTLIDDEGSLTTKVNPDRVRSKDNSVVASPSSTTTNHGKNLGWLPWVAISMMLISTAGLLYSLGLFDSLLQPSGDENVTSTELPESNETSIVKTITITSADFETALAGVEDAENLLESVGAIVPENDQQALRQQRDRAESLASEQKYDEAVSLLRQSLEQLETLRLTANRNVRFGSSSAGIERALQDCRDYYGAQNCPPEWYDEERARRVELKPFALSPTEVSFAEFAKFVDEQNHVTDAEREGSSLQLMSNHDLKQLVGYTWRQPEGAASTWENFRDNPVVHVSLEDAKAYCGWASARLPTRAEWEYAASGNTERLFADYFDKSTYSTEQADSANLASVPVNSSAIYDVKSKLFGITGNVWEWTSSIRGGSGEQYYVKGGSWKDAAIVNLRLTALRPEYPGDSYIDLGFRCVQDVERWP